MIDYLKRLFCTWPMLALGLMLAGVAMAQQAQVSGDANDMTRSVALIISNATPLVIWVLKKWIPVEAAPLVAPLIGAVSTAVINWIGGIFVDPVIGAIAGSGGVGVREAVDQSRKALGMRNKNPPGVR